jgi:hypothetical protein
MSAAGLTAQGAIKIIPMLTAEAELVAYVSAP